MKGYAMSGDDAASATVLAVGQINFEGNIIPASWFEHLRFPDGKPHTNAIVILSEIVYWYRPVEVKDERTGRLLGYRKKFKGAQLQRSRSSFEKQFGFTKRQVSTALECLEKQGVIRIEIVKSMVSDSGQRLGNVMFIELVPARLREITVPSDIDVIASDTEVIASDIQGNTYAHVGKTNTETTTETTNTERVPARRPRKPKADASNQPALLSPDSEQKQEPKVPTPQQEYFQSVCDALGWDHRILDKSQRGQVAQLVGKLQKAGYSKSDVDAFRARWFTEDWRGQKGEFPTPKLLTQEIGKLRAAQPKPRFNGRFQ